MGREPPPDWQEQLQQNLRRAQDAIQQGLHQQDDMVRAWTTGLRDAYPDWGRQRWQRQIEKKLRKKAEKEARIANASLFEGYIWTLGAVLLFILALSSVGALWWLIFPALGLGSRGAKVIARHAGKTPGAPLALEPLQVANPPLAVDKQAAERARRFGGIQSVIDGANTRGAYGGAVAPAAGAPPAIDPRDARVDAISDRILAELRDSPEVVREIFRKPEETVAALRETCKNLTRRERDVRKFLSSEEDARLVREREALQKRIDAELDEVTKLRLASALAALDQQREQRQELARSASRFEAEQTRISYTLESLYTQVVRMRSADAGSVDVAGAGLRRSLDLLSQEVNALADALEKVNAGTASAKQSASQDAPGTGAPPPTEAQRLDSVAEGPGTNVRQGPGEASSDSNPNRAAREKA